MFKISKNNKLWLIIVKIINFFYFIVFVGEGIGEVNVELDGGMFIWSGGGIFVWGGFGICFGVLLLIRDVNWIFIFVDGNCKM